MNTPELLQQALEKLDFNQQKSSEDHLFLALEKLNHNLQENNTPNLLQTLLYQSCSKFNESYNGLNEPAPFLEIALQTLNRGIVGIQEAEEVLLHEEELPTLPDLGEDVLATETMPISDLFLSIKSEYKEPRSFVLEKPATNEMTPAVITTPVNKVITKPVIENNKIIQEVTKPVLKQTTSVDLSKASYFFGSLPFEKALPKIKVVEQDTGEETHFRILPSKQNAWKNDSNLVENPIFAATLQAIQASGGTVPTTLNQNDYKTIKSQSFFSSLPWARKTA